MFYIWTRASLRKSNSWKPNISALLVNKAELFGLHYFIFSAKPAFRIENMIILIKNHQLEKTSNDTSIIFLSVLKWDIIPTLHCYTCVTCVVCFSGKGRNLNIVELQCSGCLLFHHESCISLQLGKLVPFLSNYTFTCRNCSNTRLETFKKHQARELTGLPLPCPVLWLDLTWPLTDW